MAIQVGRDGQMQVALVARDEASPVVEKFADNAESALKRASGSTAELKRETEELGGELKKTGDEGGKSVDVIAGKFNKLPIIAGAAATAVTAFGAALLTSGLRSLDTYNRLSQRLGISAEALSQLVFVARQSDVPMERLAGHIGTLQRNLAAAAATGKGPLAETLGAIGLSAEALIALKPEEQLFAVADALRAMETPAERAKFAQDAFSRGGREMIDVLQGGSQALRDGMSEADRWGATVRTGAAKDADEWSRNLSKVQGGLGGIATTIANDMAGPMAQLSKDFAEALDRSRALEGVATSLTIVLRGIAAIVAFIGHTFGQAGRAVGGFIGAVEAFQKFEFRRGIEVLREMGAEIRKAAREYDALMSRIFGLGGAAEGGLQKQSGVAAAAGEFVKVGGIFQQQRDQAGRFLPQFGAGSGLFSGAGGLGGRQQDPEQAEVERKLAWERYYVEEMRRLIEQAQLEERELTDDHMAQLETQATDSANRRLALEQFFQTGRSTLQVQHDRLSLASAYTFFGAMAQLMTSKSKSMFQVGKAAAIAQTIIDTYAAAMASYKALAGIPIIGPALGAAAAAAAVVTGMARVSAIRSTEFNGGATTATPVFAANPVTSLPIGGTTLPPSTLDEGLRSQRGVAEAPRRRVDITLHGTIFTAAMVRDELIPALNDALGDGVVLNLRTA